MMIVVAIVLVLSVVAVGAYRKHMNSARKAEVVAMFGEIRTREEAYRAEFSTYLSTTNDEDDFWPKLGAGEPKAKDWTGGAPASWTSLTLRPGKSQLYCGYTVVAGAPNSLLGAGARGTGGFATVPTQPWWYASATCDNDGNPAKN